MEFLFVKKILGYEMRGEKIMVESRKKRKVLIVVNDV